jgi:hypothetical protein
VSTEAIISWRQADTQNDAALGALN